MTQPNSKSWVKSSFEKTSKPPATKSRNVSTKSSSKISASSHSTQRIEQTDSHILWAEKYAPQNICDLAVHKKKISDIEEWVLSTNSNNVKERPFLLLSGPAGCGKTTALHVVCKQNNINVQEWINPVIYTKITSDQNLRKDVSKQESQVTLFRSFLLRANKYPNLDKKCDSCKKVILIKDFPNVFYVDQTEFRHLLRIYKQTARSPIVFIITDNNDSEDNVRLLFPKDIQVALNMHSISFNPVSNTLMLKALKLAVKVAEKQLTVTPMLQTSLDKLVATSGGDIRSAVNSLQFSCSRVANGPDVSARNLPAKSRKKRKKNDFVGNTDTELSFCGRDASLSLFRIIGKVLYCKRTDDIEKPEMDLPNNLLHMSRKSLTFCPEKILEQMPVSAECLNLFLHQNYLQFIGEMDGLIKSSEYFSDADFLMSNWASKNIMEQYSTCIASRGIMFSNQSVQSTGWRPLHKPEWFNIMRDRRNNEIDAKYRTCEFIRSDTNLFTEYIPFMKYLSVTKSHVQGHDSIIKSLSVMCNKQNSHNRFKRKELLSEQDVVVMDETVNDDIQHKNSDLILNADLDDPSEFLIEDFSD